MAHSDKPSSREARPSDRGCEFEAQCAVQAPLFSSFCLIFSSICMVIFLSPVLFMAFSFHSFLILKLIDCIVFSLANLFEAVNFFWHDFFLTAGDLTGCCLF